MPEQISDIFYLEDAGVDNALVCEDSSVFEATGEKLKLPANVTLLEDSSLLDIPSSFLRLLESNETVKDDNPFFITVTMPSGFSRYMTTSSILNGKHEAHRYWPEEVVHSFAEQIRNRRLPGYAGHGSMFSGGDIPNDIPFLWLSAAKARHKESGKGLTIARAYVRRNSPFREYLVLGMVNSFSVNAMADAEMGDVEDKKDVVLIKRAGLLSYDAVRKGTEGVVGSKVANIAKEAGEVMDKAELLKLWSSMTAEERAAFTNANPAAGANQSFAELSAEISRLNVDLAMSKASVALLEQCATELGCKPDEVLAEITKIKTEKAKLVETAITAAASTIKDENLRKMVVDRVKERNLSSVELAQKAVNDELDSIRVMASSMFKNSGFKGLTNGDRKSGSKSYLNPAFESAMNADIDIEDEDEEDEDDDIQ